MVWQGPGSPSTKELGSGSTAPSLITTPHMARMNCVIIQLVSLTRDEDPVLAKNRIRSLCASNEGRFLKVTLINILDNVQFFFIYVSSPL